MGSTTPANPVVPDLLPEIADLEDAEIPYRVGGHPAARRSDLRPRAKDRRTIVKASYARYADQLGIGTISFSTPAALAGIYYYWNDNGDHVITRDELDFGRGLVSFYGLDPANPGSAISPNTHDPQLRSGSRRTRSYSGSSGRSFPSSSSA